MKVSSDFNTGGEKSWSKNQTKHILRLDDRMTTKRARDFVLAMKYEAEINILALCTAIPRRFI